MHITATQAIKECDKQALPLVNEQQVCQNLQLPIKKKVNYSK